MNLETKRKIGFYLMIAYSIILSLGVLLGFWNMMR
jgi:hypothetical protein